MIQAFLIKKVMIKKIGWGNEQFNGHYFCEYEKLSGLCG